jgi:hypothetical protein
VSDPGRPPRWDQDDRRIGVGDARGHLDDLDALRHAAEQAGWVAEMPEAHFLPHLVRHATEGSCWVIDSTETKPDGTFEVDARWIGPPDADRRTVRTAAHGLIGAVAEATTAIHEGRGPDGPVFDVVTGTLPGQTEFASHGHTLRLRVSGPIDRDRSTGADG